MQLGEDLRGDEPGCPGSGFHFPHSRAGRLAGCVDAGCAGLGGNLARGSMRQRRTASATRPPCCYRDLGPIETCHLARSWCMIWTIVVVQGIVIDDAGAAQAARDYCRHAPCSQMRNRARIRTGARRSVPATPRSWKKASPACWARAPNCPSGGWITIEATEALTAIDVNSWAAYANASCLEETGPGRSIWRRRAGRSAARSDACAASAD